MKHDNIFSLTRLKNGVKGGKKRNKIGARPCDKTPLLAGKDKVNLRKTEHQNQGAILIQVNGFVNSTSKLHVTHCCFNRICN